MSRPRALVVGAGVAGLAAARELSGGGVDVRVLDRGTVVGGRLGIRAVELADGATHLVDTGAAYFTVSDPGFAAVVERWAGRGGAGVWTDTMALLGPGGPRGSRTGPDRWSSPSGLRSLAQDLSSGLDVRGSTAVRSVSRHEDLPAVDGEAVDAVVLAMPDPQAGRLLDVDADPALSAVRDTLTRPWKASICVYAAWEQRWWPELDAGFVADDDVLTLVADDGRRRGDGAPVLVVHTGDAVTQDHLQQPESVVATALEHLGRVLGVDAVPPPLRTGVHRWAFAAPDQPHEDAYLLTPVGGGVLGVCGDAWGPRPRVEQAWSSGRDLGRALAQRLAG